MMRADRLEHAVVSIYPEIVRRTATSVLQSDESLLWKELSACVLSSQVRYSVAVAAAEALAAQGLLNDRRTVFAGPLEAVLRTPVYLENKVAHYRFPRSKAQQLAATHAAVFASADSLAALLDGFCGGEEARQWFVVNAPGMGPKQASMFLRNTGKTVDLAVLDRHVIDYMNTLGLGDRERGGYLSTLKGYSKREAVLQSYAHGLGMAVGLLDWAIWIVMRVFKAEMSEVAYS